MGNDAHRFSKRPVTRDHIGVGTVAALGEALKKEGRIEELLVGENE